jgi:hypothetical protein
MAAESNFLMAEILYEYVVHFVFWASVVSLLLPPTEIFDSFPRFKRKYEVLVRLINHYAALNVRGKIAQSYVNFKNGGKKKK